MGRNLLQSTSLTPTGPITRPFGTGSVRFFTSTTTWTVPPGITTVRARVWGGGANSNKTGGGKSPTSVPSGGGGGFAMRVVSGLTPGSNVAVTVANVSFSGGAAGGTCSFGTHVSATGGTSGGAGGSGSGGDINYTGGSGFNVNSDNNGGGGVANLFGNGGNGNNPSNTRTILSSASGGGGARDEQGGSSLFAQGGLAFFNIVSGTYSAAHGGYSPTSGNEQNLLDLIGVGGGGGGGTSSLTTYKGQDGINGGGGGARHGSGGFPGGGAGGAATTLSGWSFGAPGLVVVEW